MTQHKPFKNLICPSCGEILKERFIMNECICLLCGFIFNRGKVFKKRLELILKEKKELDIKILQINNKIQMLYRDIRNGTIDTRNNRK